MNICNLEWDIYILGLCGHVESCYGTGLNIHCNFDFKKMYH